MPKEKVLNLAEALKRANEEALKFSSVEDNGSCNMDSVVIKLSRWKEEDIKEASELSGVGLSDKLSGLWNGYRFISTEIHGQANRRYKMVEASKDSLRKDGYDVCIYYLAD